VTSYSIYGILEQQTRPECIRVRLPRDWNTVDAVAKNRVGGVSLKESSRKERRYEAKELNYLPTYLKPVTAVAVKATCCDEPGMITLSSFGPETDWPEVSSAVKHRGSSVTSSLLSFISRLFDICVVLKSAVINRWSRE
jgi:hypothetical protein